MHYLRFVLLILLCLPGQKAFLQPTIRVADEQQWLANDSGALPDSSIAFIHRYLPAQQQLGFYRDLGNAGSPAAGLVGFQVQPTGFVHGFQAGQLYGFQPHQYGFYHTRRPYTSVQYVQGTGRLLGLQLLHTQNIGSRLNVGVHFKRLGSRGFYQNQNTDWYSGRFFQSWRSVGGAYRVAAHLTVTHGQWQENGGLADTAAFAGLSVLQRQAAEVRFTEAANVMTDRQLYMKQWWSPGKKGTDSLNRRFWLSHTLMLQAEAYTDSLTKADQKYFDTFFDTTRTLDSFQFTTLENRLEASLHLGSPLKPGWRGNLSGGYLNSRVSGHLGSLPALFTNHAMYAHLLLGKAGQQFTLKAQYYAWGYNRGDYLLEGAYSVKNKEGHVLRLHLLRQRFMPAYTQQYFYSNHFVWANTFVQQELNQLQTSLKLKSGTYLQATWQQIGNLVATRLFNRPVQLGAPDNVTAVVAEAFHKIENRHWYVAARVFWQHSNSVYLPLASHGLLLNACYKGRYLQSSLHYRVGVDINYTQAAPGYGWNPITRQYVIVTLSRNGGYPMADVYVSGQIKTFAFFVKAEHILANTVDLPSPYTRIWQLLPTSYFTSSGYPMAGFMLRLGFHWQFAD